MSLHARTGHAVECFHERASLVGLNLMCLIHLVDKTIIRHGIDNKVLHVARVITSLSNDELARTMLSRCCAKLVDAMCGAPWLKRLWRRAALSEAR